MGARATRVQHGFTLLELLMIMAILGIIAGLFGLQLLRTIRQSELRDAAYQIIGDLRRARTGAQKTGVINQVKVTAGSSDYTVKVGGNAPVPLTLPHRVKVTAQSGGVALDYQPPFGTLDTTGVWWKLTSPTDAGLNLYVKAIGITGKVMLSATQD